MIEEKETDTEIQKAGPKTALVSIVGRPSAGKSTFLNTASGEKISIVSPVPQTTRNAIRGIINTSLGQLVFIDTQGLHLSEKKLNLKLSNIALTFPPTISKFLTISPTEPIVKRSPQNVPKSPKNTSTPEK